MSHVLTGEYDGTITRMVRGESREYPKAVTACGAAADGSAIRRTVAVASIMDGYVQELCPDCRARVESVIGVRPMTELSGRRGSVSGPQLSYLRRLLREAFAAHYVGDVHLDSNHLEGTTARYASFAIGHLIAAKARGWTLLKL